MKETLIKEYLLLPVKVGEGILVRGYGSQNKITHFGYTTVAHIDKEGEMYIKEYGNLQKVDKKDWKKCTYKIGANPFSYKKDRVQSVSFQLESILYQVGILEYEKENYKIKDIEVKRCNWNPFIYNSLGEKEYYQRPLVWSIDDKRNLVESIYNNIDCGKVLIRKRSWNEITKLAEKGENELAWHDIVDGKQRLNAIKEFINNEFTDYKGNYFQDLSGEAQGRFLNHQLLSYSELPENSEDSEIIEQFLKLNFCGVPQSKQHIEYVKEISNRL